VELSDCLACGGDNLVPVLSLGNQPLANSLMDSKKETPKAFPLAINRCSNCFHVQLTHAVNPDLMFKNYLYVSGTSKTMDDHFKWFAKYTCEYFTALTALKPSRVLDIGCNDGSQLNHFKTLGLGTFGVDPATNLLSMSSKKHCVYPDYFNIDFVTKNPGTYDIITAQNVFAHNYDPKGFLTSARNIMSNDSLLFIQTSQADMILNNEFDTIYHEHISFFNIRSMRHLCDRSGL
jgi:SAM-dependent methyltransferase